MPCLYILTSSAALSVRLAITPEGTGASCSPSVMKPSPSILLSASKTAALLPVPNEEVLKMVAVSDTGLLPVGRDSEGRKNTQNWRDSKRGGRGQKKIWNTKKEQTDR